jgi:hypothetical protein
MVGGGVGAGGVGGQSTSQAVSEVLSGTDQIDDGKKEMKTSLNGTKSLSAQPVTRIDDNHRVSVSLLPV